MQPPHSLSIKRRWRDPEGRVWYIVRGPLAEGGYPRTDAPSKAFQKALAEATQRRLAEAAPPPEPTELNEQDVHDLLYRVRVDGSK